MTTPSFPPFYDMPYTDKDGKLTPQSKLFNDTVFQLLNSLLSTDWAIIPNNNTAGITALLAQAPLGAIWFNTDIAKLQVKTAGGVSPVLQTITST